MLCSRTFCHCLQRCSRTCFRTFRGCSRTFKRCSRTCFRTYLQTFVTMFMNGDGYQERQSVVCSFKNGTWRPVFRQFGLNGRNAGRPPFGKIELFEIIAQPAVAIPSAFKHLPSFYLFAGDAAVGAGAVEYKNSDRPLVCRKPCAHIP